VSDVDDLTVPAIDGGSIIFLLLYRFGSPRPLVAATVPYRQLLASRKDRSSGFVWSSTAGAVCSGFWMKLKNEWSRYHALQHMSPSILQRSCYIRLLNKIFLTSSTICMFQPRTHTVATTNRAKPLGSYINIRIQFLSSHFFHRHVKYKT
jgi:hypothetical protein